MNYITHRPAAKSSPIRANTNVLSFDRRDSRQLGLGLTPAEQAADQARDTANVPPAAEPTADEENAP